MLGGLAVRIGDLLFVVRWDHTIDDPEEWKSRCRGFLKSLSVEDIPIPEEGTEAEQLQRIGEWALRAFLDSQDLRHGKYFGYLSVEVKRVPS